MSTQAIAIAQGSFNNYVDKMRWVGGKNVYFCPRLSKECTLWGKKGQNYVHVVIWWPPATTGTLMQLLLPVPLDFSAWK